MKSIGCVQFGCLTPDQWRAYASAEITTPTNKGNTNIDGTPYDRRLGALENGAKCETCGEKNATCPGHFGYIELPEECFNPEYIEIVCSILKCICIKCVSPRITTFPSQLRGDQRFRAYKKKAEVLQQCSSCHESLPGFFIDKDKIKYFMGDKKSAIPITAREIYSIFVQITSETMKLLGFNDRLSENEEFASDTDDDPHIHEVRPEAFILKVLPVLPTCARPFVVKGSEKKDDDITDRYNTILKIVNRLKSTSGSSNVAAKKKKDGGKLKESDRAKLVQDLQSNVWTLIDNSKEGKIKNSNRQHKGLRERLGTKEGHIQSNIAGKRVDYTARTVVVGAGPDLPIGWIGVPESIAKKVTIPELVTKWNLAVYTEMLAKGKIVAVKRQGNTIRVAEATKQGVFSWKDKAGLQLYDVVDRHLRDGDWVILNRQPTLRVESMQGVQIKVLKDEYVFRIPLGMTRPFNMDQ